MKKIYMLLVVCFLLIGCNKQEKTFELEEKYYQNSDFIELSEDKLNALVKDKESFAIFVYQPLCETSSNFEKILKEFTNKYQISFYKMPFSKVKETNLKEYIKFYPSLIIYRDGEIVDYLDANSADDIDYYKSLDQFQNWFTQYVTVKEVINKNNTEQEETVEEIYKNENIVLEDVKYDKNKINIYMFWGNGCPFCENAIEFFNSIEDEYGKYFKLNKYEIWNNEYNKIILKEFSRRMNENVTSIPYIIIGNKTFVGFNDNNKKEIINAIKSQYKNSYDVYFSEQNNEKN